MGKIRIRVKLEPGLEEQVTNMNPEQRLLLAAVYARWARQLRVSAKILLKDAKPAMPLKLKLKWLPKEKLVLN